MFVFNVYFKFVWFLYFFYISYIGVCSFFNIYFYFVFIVFDLFCQKKFYCCVLCYVTKTFFYFVLVGCIHF